MSTPKKKRVVAKSVAVKFETFDQVLARAQKAAEEFAKLPKEEQDRRNAATEEILKQLRGTPGFMEIKL